MNSQPSVFSYRDKPLSGLGIYATAVFFIVAMNAFVKKSADYHNPVEILFYRSLIGLVILTAGMGVSGNLKLLKTTRLKGHLGRALFGNIGAGLVFWTFSLMPMADATAFLYTVPFIVIVLSALILGERVGLFKILAVLTGFIGVILIAQPSGEAYPKYAVIVAIGAAFAAACVRIFLRDLGKTENTVTTVFYFLLFGTLFSGLYMIFAGTLPQTAALFPLAGAAVCAVLQLLMKTQAYRWAQASVLTPVLFTSIVWATLIGWLYWGDIPDLSVIVGVVVIIVANLIIVWRERRASKCRQKEDLADKKTTEAADRAE